MKPVHILGAIGVVGILVMGAWYMYMQQAPLPAAEAGGGMTDSRGLAAPIGTSAAKPKPKAKAPEAPKAPAAPAATPKAPAPAPTAGTEAKAPAQP